MCCHGDKRHDSLKLETVKGHAETMSCQVVQGAVASWKAGN